MPPDMPAPKLRPVRPSTTTRPPVMYSHPWSPTPSTTEVVPEHGADRAVDVADGVLDEHGLAPFEGGGRLLDEHVVQRLVEAVVLRVDTEPGVVVVELRNMQDGR